MSMTIEIDEEVPVLKASIVDDDGDVVPVTSVVCESSNPGVIDFFPLNDEASPELAVAKAMGPLGTSTLTMRITTTQDNVSAEVVYTADLSVGITVPVGGALPFGNVRKQAS